MSVISPAFVIDLILRHDQGIKLYTTRCTGLLVTSFCVPLQYTVLVAHSEPGDVL